MAHLIKRQAKEVQGDDVLRNGGQDTAGNGRHLAGVAGLETGAHQVNQRRNHG
jgi:hypothetical protein